MPQSPKVSFGRFKGPSQPGDNEYSNKPNPMDDGRGSGPLDWEDFCGTEPQNSRDPYMNGGPISHRNRRSRRVSGPSYSSAKDLEYRGT